MNHSDSPISYVPVDLGGGYSDALGMVHLDADAQRICFRVTAAQLNPVATLHGGALATFCDAQIIALFGSPLCWDAHFPTISLSTDFLAPAREGDLVEADVLLVKQTRTMVFTQCLIRVGEDVIGRSSAIYRRPSGITLA